MHALGLESGSAAQLSKRPGSVWNCLWINALRRSPGVIRKSRVSYPGPGFLSSAPWPSLPKKHYNGLYRLRLVVSISAPHTADREFASRRGHTKDHHKNRTNWIPSWYAMRQGRILAVQPGCLKGRLVCETVYGDMHL